MSDEKNPEMTALDRVIAHLDERDELQKRDKAQLISYREQIRKLDEAIAEIGARIVLEREK